ncbi:response regulator transcription factor [Aureibacillus halotolerans]|uniref:DNA-binding response OmpR family regulator n=1 Tax=Aureibacillus halotolerans TaxID=1508390 RepID=A0A4R6TW12_9BACI|nr:response regulator transcription factor [Aureibacillus halotolerans]TDQ37426.1 DNA-binding response OmpR family regulator [Aureibacillus halotolerans]
MRHLLIVDDDPDIVNLIAIYLQNEGYEVSKAYNGEEALALLNEVNIDLIVLDVMMPKLDGIEVTRRVREKQDLPILMVSAKAEDMDKIMGLMTGADDYMIKPFNPLELVARVKSLLRRSYTFKTSAAPIEEKKEDEIQCGSILIHKARHQVTVEGEVIPLTAKEFDILHLMATNAGRVYSAEDLFEYVWKETYFSSNNTVMVHISNLRDKLERKLGYKIIHTIWGVGYKFEA